MAESLYTVMLRCGKPEGRTSRRNRRWGETHTGRGHIRFCRISPVFVWTLCLGKILPTSGLGYFAIHLFWRAANPAGILTAVFPLFSFSAGCKRPGRTDWKSVFRITWARGDERPAPHHKPV